MLKSALKTAMLATCIATVASAAEARDIKVRITAGPHALTATLLDNATSRAFVARLPLTVPMTDLYNRELVYHFPDPLPANEAGTSGYDVGDIIYWTPRKSFVIMYAQNGEIISNLQKVGRVDAGVEVFRRTGNIDVRFELAEK